MVSYTHSLTGGLIQPSTMSYGAYTFKTDLVLVWPSSFSNNPHVTAAIIDLTAEEEGLKVILPDARVVSVGQNILLNNRGEEDIALYGRDSEEAFFVLKPGSSFYIYLTNNTTIPGIWSVIPFGQGAVVVTSVGAESDDPEALGIEGSPVTGAGRFLFKLSNTLRALSVFAKKGFATLTSKGWEGRQIVAGQNITVKDGEGEKGNPVIGTEDNVGFKNAAIEVLEIAKLSSKEVIKEFNIEKGAIHNALMAQNSTNIDKLKSSGHAELIVGDDADYKYRNLAFPTNKVTIPTRLPKETSVSMHTLPDLFNRSENRETVDGMILKPLSIASTALKQGNMSVPFATGVVQYDGNWHQHYNCTFVRNATGAYSIRFNQSASWVYYIVLVNVNANSAENPVAAFVTNKSKTGFAVYIYNLDKRPTDAGFSFMVWDFI